MNLEKDLVSQVLDVFRAHAKSAQRVPHEVEVLVENGSDVGPVGQRGKSHTYLLGRLGAVRQAKRPTTCTVIGSGP